MPEERIGLFQAIVALIAQSSLTELADLFRVWFRAFLATVMVVGGGWFLWSAAMLPDEKLNEYTGVIIGFITASFVGIAVSFYFGGQDGEKKKGGTNEESI